MYYILLYNPRTNGLVERFHRQLKDSFRLNLNDFLTSDSVGYPFCCQGGSQIISCWTSFWSSSQTTCWRYDMFSFENLLRWYHHLCPGSGLTMPGFALCHLYPLLHKFLKIYQPVHTCFFVQMLSVNLYSGRILDLTASSNVTSLPSITSTS